MFSFSNGHNDFTLLPIFHLTQIFKSGIASMYRRETLCSLKLDLHFAVAYRYCIVDLFCCTISLLFRHMVNTVWLFESIFQEQDCFCTVRYGKNVYTFVSSMYLFHNKNSDYEIITSFSRFGKVLLVYLW